MKNELKYLQLAVMFFTRLPLPALSDFQASDQSRAVKYFPLVGILVGSIVACVLVVSNLILPKEPAIIISIIAGLMLTGGFHEDGLADTLDGLGGGWQAEQKLSIMQDSRLGSYGALALIMCLLLKYQTLNAMPNIILTWCLISGHTVSRFAALWIMTRLNYIRATGKSKDIISQLTKSERLTAIIICLIPLSFNLPAALAGLIPVIAIWFYFVGKLNQQLNGYTGDNLGAMQQLTEVGFYLGVLAWSAT